MATTYAYEQRYGSGSASGYIKYNITPDFSEYIIPGQTVHIQGVIYCPDYDVAFVSAGLYEEDSYFATASFSKVAVEAPRKKETQFNASFTVPNANSGMPDTRFFQFVFRLSMARANNSGDLLTPQTEQKYTYVKYGLVKDVKISFARHALIDGVYKQVDDGTKLVGSVKITLHEEATIFDITRARVSITPGVEYPSDGFDIPVSIAATAASDEGYVETEPAIFADYEFLAGKTYSISVAFGDAIMLTGAKMDIPAAIAAFHVAGHNKGVCFGGFSTASEEDPKLESHWPAYLYGGLGGSTLNLVASQVFDVMAHWIWPIGCLYFDADGLGPPPWVGTWEKVESGRFIVSAEDYEGTGTYKPGATGGAASQRISVAAHKHTITTQDNVKFVSGAVTSGSYDIPITGTSNTAGAIDQNVSTIPPYLAVTIWKRVE